MERAYSDETRRTLKTEHGRMTKARQQRILKIKAIVELINPSESKICEERVKRFRESKNLSRACIILLINFENQD